MTSTVPGRMSSSASSSFTRRRPLSSTSRLRVAQDDLHAMGVSTGIRCVAAIWSRADYSERRRPRTRTGGQARIAMIQRAHGRRHAPSWSRVPWETSSSRPDLREPMDTVREDIAELPMDRRPSTVSSSARSASACCPFVDSERCCSSVSTATSPSGFYWEIPTGGQHPGETLEEAAQRELAEEAGVRGGAPRQALRLPHVEEHPARSGPPVHGDGAAPRLASADHTEFIERRVFPFEEVLAMVERGRDQGLNDSRRRAARRTAALARDPRRESSHPQRGERNAGVRPLAGLVPSGYAFRPGTSGR